MEHVLYDFMFLHTLALAADGRGGRRMRTRWRTSVWRLGQSRSVERWGGAMVIAPPQGRDGGRFQGVER